MDNQNLLTGAVMLETMWKTRKKDLLDLISPFIVYSASKVCSPGEIVDQQKILDIVKTEFGYFDMPLTIVQRVMKRSTYFKCENKKYRLMGNLDATVAEIEKRRDECEKKIQTLSDQLVDYLEVHSKYHRKITADQATHYLQDSLPDKGSFLVQIVLKSMQTKSEFAKPIIILRSTFMKRKTLEQLNTTMRLIL